MFLNEILITLCYILLMQDSGKFILWNSLYLELPISGMWLIVHKKIMK
jgi:hypothetical protein